MKPSPARQKSYEFAVATVVFCRKIHEPSIRPLLAQLIRSGTSIGANVEEAAAAQSRKDFICKMSIASKEARESNYWLRVMRDSAVANDEQTRDLIARSQELTKILSSIVKTMQDKDAIDSRKKLKTHNSKLTTASVLKEAP
jgi:four helix bundle protein